ncbi:hypothetical protein [Pelomonas sp. KK5]|uniref:hypothetical protein n=1 Tax=Pelomonas sp. KK5 TaxID=1855730 RepID=UPI00097C3C48|nr:hypothetical protein [Pelomonas sp. KK5]
MTTTTSIPATIVNHVAIEIDAPPEAVWLAIQAAYVEARKFREAGAIEAVDDPATVLAYRMRIGEGAQLDERLVRITELDHAARRLSAHADYLTQPPGGMGVWACYHAQPHGAQGTRYAIDCHARLGVEVAQGSDRAAIAAAVAAMKAAFDASLLAYLGQVKASLEGAA